MRTALTLVALLAATLTFAQDPITLKRTVKEGETAKYNLSMEGQVATFNFKFTAKVIEKVTKVNADGTFVVNSEQQDAMLDLNGQQTPVPPEAGGGASSTFNVDGSVSEMKGEQVNADAYRMANIQSLLWPKAPVAIGAKWDAKIAENKTNSTPAVKTSYEVLASETIMTRSCFKIAFDATEESGSDPASSKGTVWVDTSNGQIVKMEAEWKNAPIAGQQINGKVVMALTE